MDYAADGQTSDAYEVTLAPAPTAYFTGMVVKFKANTLNTGACTLNVNSLGAKTLKKNVSSDLETGDILANQIVTVIYDGTNFQVLSHLSTTISNNGWILANETWTYASASTITVPSGAASKYKKGDKIKITQTTVKYFYITGVTDTILTVFGGTDYTVANEAITDNYYSHQANPIGFPHWFAVTPTTTGWSGSPTKTCFIKIDGETVHFNFYITGTSDNANVYITPGISLSSNQLYAEGVLGRAVNNGNFIGTACRISFDGTVDGNLFRCFTDMGTAGWTTSGTKTVCGYLIYRMS